MSEHSVVGDVIGGIAKIFTPKTKVSVEATDDGISNDPGEIARRAELKKEAQQYQTSSIFTAGSGAGLSDKPMTTSRVLTGY